MSSGAHYRTDEFGAEFAPMCYCDGDCSCSPYFTLEELEEIMEEIKNNQKDLKKK